MKAKTFRKTFPMLPAIALTAATLALMAALPARATTFIKDVMLIGGTSGETTALKNSLTTNGWTFFNYDLNKGCGNSSDYVYLLYKAEADTSGNRDYVTGFYIKSGASNVTTTFTSGGKTYTLTPYYGGSHFNDQKGDLNSNAGGDAIPLYYTKDASSGRAVSSVALARTAPPPPATISTTAAATTRPTSTCTSRLPSSPTASPTTSRADRCRAARAIPPPTPPPPPPLP